jgi:7-cyano-7-deazaguanine synthase
VVGLATLDPLQAFPQKELSIGWGEFLQETESAPAKHMTERSSEKPIGLLLSGGLDSAILLGHLLQRARPVRPFYIQSRLVWQREELQAVKRLLQAMSSPQLQELGLLELPLADVYDDHWAVTGRHTPGAESPDEAVYLPGRNVLLTIKAALWCQLHGVEELALAVLGTSPFADAKPGFFEQFQAVLNCAGPAQIRIVYPFARMGKREVMQSGRDLPLGLTFSCIAPVEGLHCGKCNKCAERQAAFRMLGVEDPTPYAPAAMPKPDTANG